VSVLLNKNQNISLEREVTKLKEAIVFLSMENIALKCRIKLQCEKPAQIVDDRDSGKQVTATTSAYIDQSAVLRECHCEICEMERQPTFKPIVRTYQPKPRRRRRLIPQSEGSTQSRTFLPL
jgi:hypothetical protein